MTAVDVVFRYGNRPDERVMGAIAHVRDVYGVRKISFDEKEKTVRVEYDATRLSESAVAHLLRGAGLDLKEPVELV